MSTASARIVASYSRNGQSRSISCFEHLETHIKLMGDHDRSRGDPHVDNIG